MRIAQTIEEARQLRAGQGEDDKVTRMRAWILRHRGDWEGVPRNSNSDDESFPGPGAVAAYLWGVDPTAENGADRVLEWADGVLAPLTEEERFDVKELETRALPMGDFTVREDEDGQKTFTGYAALFGAPSAGLPFTEVIAPGAFRRTLSRVADGSWFVSYLVDNDDVWARVKEGEFKGFSVEGVFDFPEEKDEQILEAMLAELEAQQAAEAILAGQAPEAAFPETAAPEVAVGDNIFLPPAVATAPEVAVVPETIIAPEVLAVEADTGTTGGQVATDLGQIPINRDVDVIGADGGLFTGGLGKPTTLPPVVVSETKPAGGSIFDPNALAFAPTGQDLVGGSQLGGGAGTGTASTGFKAAPTMPEDTPFGKIYNDELARRNAIRASKGQLPISAIDTDEIKQLADWSLKEQDKLFEQQDAETQRQARTNAAAAAQKVGIPLIIPLPIDPVTGLIVSLCTLALLVCLLRPR